MYGMVVLTSKPIVCTIYSGSAFSIGDECPCCGAGVVSKSEVEIEGWDGLQDHFAFRYLPESGRTQDALQVYLPSPLILLIAQWSAALRPTCITLF